MSEDLKHHLTHSARFFGGCVALAFTLGFIFEVSEFLLFMFGLAFIPALLLGFAIGTFLYARDGITIAVQPGTRYHRLMAGIAAPAMAMATLPLLALVFAAGGGAAVASQLLFKQRSYSRIVADVQSGSLSRTGNHEAYGVTFEADPGSPLRVAFDLEGLLDNATGIVFDSTGDVMKADGFDPVTGKFRAPDEVTKLFGGDLVACRWMWGDFYSCSFT